LRNLILSGVTLQMILILDEEIIKYYLDCLVRPGNDTKGINIKRSLPRNPRVCYPKGHALQ